MLDFQFYMTTALTRVIKGRKSTYFIYVLYNLYTVKNVSKFSGFRSYIINGLPTWVRLSFKHNLQYHFILVSLILFVLHFWKLDHIFLVLALYHILHSHLLLYADFNLCYSGCSGSTDVSLLGTDS